MPSVSSKDKVLDTLIRHMANEEEDPLTPLLDRYFLERDKSPNRLRSYTINMEERPRPLGRLSPSSICACERQAAFKFVGMPGRTRIDPETQAIFDDGHWRHHKWQARFLDMELVLNDKKLFRVHSIEEDVAIEKLYIAGALDACISINRQKWVVDFKGILSWGFDYVYREGKPHHVHVLQLLCYMVARKIRRGMIIYDHKDRSKTKVYIVRFTRAQWDEVEDWCLRVIEQLDQKVLPPMSPDCQSGTLIFEKCPWAHLCYGDRDKVTIRRRMYRGFESTKQLWSEGNAIVAAHREGS